MRSVGLFAEDFGHESFLTALVLRLAREHRIDVKIQPKNVRGGHGKVLGELRRYLRELKHGRADLVDLLVVATDANCVGYSQRSSEVQSVIDGEFPELKGWAIAAVPDPHVERWLLIDSQAFKQVLGRGCPAPDQKCDRDRYKGLLLAAFRQAGISPPLGGMEYAEDLVKAMDLKRAEQLDPSFNHLLSDLTKKFNEWSQ
jgi:hypothetical protein